MRVFRVGCEVDSRPWLQQEPPERDFLGYFDGHRRAVGWSSPGLTFNTEERPPADFTRVNFAPFPAVNRRARIYLERCLDDWVEFLPLDLGGEERWLAHVLLVSDCLDADRTKFRSSGVPFRYAFDADCLAQLDVPLFQITELSGAAVFATRDFVTAYEATGLTGLAFTPLNQAF